MPQGIGLFAGQPVLGIDFPHSRGVSPSTGLMRIVPRTSFDRVVGDLALSFNGSSGTLTDVAVTAVPQENFEDRDAFRWNVALQDRRWRWRYPRISGTYNRRLCDGTIDPKGKKSVPELVALLAAELQDTIDPGSIPEAYPPIVWDGALARFELAWLCDLFGMTVCPKVDNTFALEPITATASLPPGGTPVTPPGFSHKISVMPSGLRVQGSPDRKQGWVPLRCIWRDRDGKYDVPNNMSYTPGTGWGTQWPNIYPDVPPTFSRQLAFETGYRLYAPVDPTIILDDHLIEVGLDVPADRKRCLPSHVRGQFNSHDDFATTADGPFSADFKFRKELNALEFEYPVYVIQGGAIAPATLEVNTGYYVVDSDGNPASSYEKDKAVTAAQKATRHRVLRHPELGIKEIVDALYGGTAGSNESLVDAEADLYLNPVSDGYTYQEAKDVIFNGLIFPDTTAGIAQLHWLCGNSRVATTRVGVNTEVDVTSATHQQRRAQERLSQMAERMGF